MGSNDEARKKILIVEDELIISMLEEQIVTKIGCEVVGKVTNSTEALNIFRETGPDLVLIDIALRGPMDGIQLIKKMRKVSEVPAIVISGESDKRTGKLTYREGHTELIQKPFSRDDLLASVEHILEI